MLNEMTNEQLQAIVDLTEARILIIEKDTLRQKEQQLLWSLDLEVEVRTYWMDLRKYWLDKKLPPCTCADHENGFLAKQAYNPFYYGGEPCSLAWMELTRKEGRWLKSTV